MSSRSTTKQKAFHSHLDAGKAVITNTDAVNVVGNSIHCIHDPTPHPPEFNKAF
jgi:hypothetical protein